MDLFSVPEMLDAIDPALYVVLCRMTTDPFGVAWDRFGVIGLGRHSQNLPKQRFGAKQRRPCWGDCH